MLKCDVLIIGGSLAGLSAGISASNDGLKVVVIERKDKIGVPVQCAEYIPKPMLNELGFKTKSVIQEIQGMITYTPDLKKHFIDLKGYTISRFILENELYEIALKNGVQIFLNSNAFLKDGNIVFIKKENDLLQIETKVIIGADGPLSTAGRWINSKNSEFIFAIQYTLPLKRMLEYTEVYFNKDYFGGYGWLFPKGDVANVGIGVKLEYEKKNLNLNSMLNKFVSFLESEGKVSFKPILKTSGLIPVGKPLKKVKENVLLTGDAAGLVHSITGGGIPQAVISGKIAGFIAEKAINKNDLSILANYEKECNKIFKRTLDYAHNKRRLLEENWGSLDNIIKSSWIGFKEYYKV